MALIESAWLEIALMGSLVLSAAAVVLAFSCALRMRKQVGLTQKLFQRLDHNLKVSNSGSIGMGKRLMALEQEIERADLEVASKTLHDAPSAAVSPVIDDSLKDAASLLHAGVSPDEVARRCGISRAEASLMQLMRSQVYSTSAAA